MSSPSPSPSPNTSTLFARAGAYAHLTPGERALLKLIEGLACAGLVAALPIVAGALTSSGAVNWADVGRAALAAAAVAVLLAIAKYAKAHGDPPIGPAVAQAATDVAADVLAGKSPQQIAKDAASDTVGAAAQVAAANAAPTA